MKKMKILISTVLFILILFSSALANPPADVDAGTVAEITLQPGNKQYRVNAQELTMSTVPFNTDGRIFVPVDFLGSVLGTTDEPIHWRVGSGEIDLVVPARGSDFLEIKLQAENNLLLVNYLNNGSDSGAREIAPSKTIIMDVTPLLKEGQIYLPVRWVAEACGFTVAWDSSTQRVLLTAPDPEAPVVENDKNVKDETGRGLPGGVEINPRVIKSSSTQMELDLQIPVITGLRDRTLQEQINKEIMDKALQTKAELEQSYAELAEYAQTSGFPMHTFQLFVRYETYICGNIVSLAVETYQYSGGAHGGTKVVFYNLDTKNNKQLALSGLFQDDLDYLSIINQEITKQIAAQIESGKDICYFEGEGGFRSIDANHPFYLKDEALILHFGQYEIAPYAAGMPEFIIPLTFLEEHLREELFNVSGNGLTAQKSAVSHFSEENTKDDFYE